MDKGLNWGHKEGPSFENDIEVMPDSDHQGTPLRRHLTPKTCGIWPTDRSIRILISLAFLLLPFFTLIATVVAETNDREQKADPNGYDIAVVIDNRAIAGSPSAEEDVKAITDMLDRHMFADHIIQLERPSFPTICDIFGGCPNENNQLWPSLIAQITDPKRSRLFVYYLGPARLEGQQRELLFKDGSGNESPYTVGWLHKRLEKTEPKSALVMMETSFSPRPLPCLSENPELIDQTMTTISQNYRKLMEGRGLPRKLAELSATLPGQAPHCDRYELISDKIERPLFTKFLLKGVVEGKADEDDDGMIELGELSAYTQAKISRAVQFQWGRKQTVWLTGPGSRVVASVKPREATFKPPPKKKHKLPEPRPERPRPPKVRAEPNRDAAKEPATQSHICDLDPAAEGCLQFCADNPDDLRCGFIGFIGVNVCLDQPIGADCPCALHDPRQGCADEVAKCQWSDPELAQGLSQLVAAVGGSPDNICQWATMDEAEIEASVPWKLFAPIGWRLTRPSVRPSVGCLLNCAGDGREAGVSQSEAEPPVAVLIEMSEQDPGATAVDDQVFESPLLSPRTAFEEEVCDETLPPYIGMPRWMPGTLAISETLRFFSDCEPQRLMTFATPPPVTLVDAPPVPKPIYLPPPPFALPPPTILPPIEQPLIALPVFEPTVSQIRWLQSALTLGNHNPGPIDGAMGDQTEEAIRSWRGTKTSTMAHGALSELEFNLIVKEFGELFDQVHPGAPLY